MAKGAGKVLKASSKEFAFEGESGVTPPFSGEEH
jgi:hypothetical protein